MKFIKHNNPFTNGWWKLEFGKKMNSYLEFQFNFVSSGIGIEWYYNRKIHFLFLFRILGFNFCLLIDLYNYEEDGAETN